MTYPYYATESGHLIAVAMGRQLVIYFGDQGFIINNPAVPQLREHTTVESFQGDTPEQLLARIRAQLPTFGQDQQQGMANENLPQPKEVPPVPGELLTDYMAEELALSTHTIEKMDAEMRAKIERSIGFAIYRLQAHWRSFLRAVASALKLR